MDKRHNEEQRLSPDLGTTLPLAPGKTSLAVGDRLTVTIAHLAWGGAGIAQVDHWMLSVPFVIPGEVVEVELTKVTEHTAWGRLLKVLHASPERVTPRCPYFGECGGCQYQHIDYPAQLRFKHQQVVQGFENIGGFPTDRITPVVPCPQPYGYRNRIMVRSWREKATQRMLVGFLRYDSRRVVDIEHCPIAEPLLNEQLTATRINPPPKGGLKVVLRKPAEGWEVPRDSFFQNNFFLLPKLVEVVRERIRTSGVRHLVDVYCGVGLFAIALSDLVISFAGIEIDQRAITAARRNAADRQRQNGEFLAGDAAQLLPALLQQFSATATAVVLDPPRRGCSAASLQLLRDVHPAQIIYVSCHPATLARDLQVLCADDIYELVQVVPLDMFPQTQHVECVADLRVRYVTPSRS